ncbi:MAG: hypothetical protein JOZ58_20360, partial [Acetobacteraceae bacterium]|nr:hypothetical protein [Acetobacteraceae bacterium]
AAWAEAMAEVAAECTADMIRLPPAERAREKARIDALLEASTALASGTIPSFGNPLVPLADLAAPVATPSEQPAFASGPAEPHTHQD